MTFPAFPSSGRHQAPGQPPPSWTTSEPSIGVSRHGSHDGGNPAWTAQQDRDHGWWDPAAQRGYGQPPPAAPRQQEQWTPPPPAFDTQPAGWGLPEEPTDEEKLWADARRQVAARIRSINAKHCQEAFDRLGGRQALSPHGVVLFYTGAADGVPHGYQLYFVTRLFLQGPESDDLAHVIHDLNRSATMNIQRANATGKRWDPRGPVDSMVNGGDMQMPRDAAFIGVGVSTLNTQQGDWYTVAMSVRNQPITTPRPRTVFDISGVGLATLIDGTNLRVDRDPERRIGDDGVTCNKTLDAYRARHWNRATDITEQGDREIRGAWAQLTVLQRTLQDYLNPGHPS
jgi:hypothetical protein